MILQTAAWILSRPCLGAATSAVEKDVTAAAAAGTPLFCCSMITAGLAVIFGADVFLSHISLQSQMAF